MSLDNLVKTGQLKRHATDRAEVGRLLAAARRNLADARGNISVENRFDAAYKCVMQCALAALMASGFRPDTKAPGHHQTVVQSLPKTLGLPGERVAVLDALRHKRNLADYTGAAIDAASLATCIVEAERLLDETGQWLAAKYPQLMP
ncbi:MAG: DNA-binding protein [Burkholderiales bacterium]